MVDKKQQPAYLLVGEILRPHGVRGEMRMKILTDYPQRLINDVKIIYLGNDPMEDLAEEYILKSARFHKDYLLITLKEINDRDEAAVLRGQKVMIDLENAVPLEDGEYYLYQLIGLRVETTDGIELGEVKSVMETGANDVYVVKGRTYGEVLVPAHEETIIKIDFEEERIIMQLPEGLLPE